MNDLGVQTADRPLAETAQPPVSEWKRTYRKFVKNPVGIIGLAMVLMITLMSIAAPLLTSHDPIDVHLEKKLQPPVWQEGGSWEHWLGTDEVGRDVWARLVYGSRISLAVGFFAVVISLVLGTALGMLAGYFRGKTDFAISTVIDIMMAFPFILLALATIAVMGPSLLNMILVLGLTDWTQYARLVRSEVINLREQEFIQAGYALGSRHWRIIWKHLLPNCLPSVIVLATLAMARAILMESSLSFLGLGVSSPTPSWGFMMSTGRPYIATAWWLATLPGIAILITVLGINLAGDRIRDLLDPKVD
ncbi:ABC transporter permease [Brevibacillus sp. LEMMJ03]|jgi:ABC-type dipeptide/oligopeptide/nickel transport system permease subunit|uniref:ABC transporter permease n=1 Tax=unclassified Brevibacillus TaxID=2684853 RepID=UPI0006986BBA|nr:MULTISPECIES: ABC transporter permease [unclassified Brevibacillus]TRY27097.1 ABC transporter permease [Brevibacillus sp. LEMMJ03]UYZ14568.1 ABC transporter permease [Brevibacillus sp. WF146]